MNRTVWIGILTLQVTAFTIGTDFTGVLLLVGPIESEFTADITTTQWVLNLYASSFAVFMIAGGRIGDLYGRRRTLLVGAGVFIVATLGCLFSPSIGWLIAARAVQGVGAALMFPSILGMAHNLGGKEHRSMIIGLVMAGVTTGNVIGPLISGIVVTLGDWRYFFAVNAVLALGAVPFVLRFLEKEPPISTDESVDFRGIAAIGIALVALMYGLDVGEDWGWLSPTLWGLFALSAVLFVAFPFIEARVRDPMISKPLMHNRQFLLILTLNALQVPAVFGAILYLPQYLQKVLGWTVLESSFGVAPFMVLLALGSIISGRFYDSVGPRCMIGGGYALITFGAAWMVLLPDSAGFLVILPAMLTMGLGAAISVGSTGTAAMGAVAPERAGLVGGISFTVHLAFGAIGVAGMTAIMYATSFATLRDGLSAAGITLPSADVTKLNGLSPDSDLIAGVLGTHGADAVEKVRALLLGGFETGLSYAYALALVSVVIGLICCFWIDEQKLRTEEAG